MEKIIEDDIQDIRMHVNIMNNEMGQLRDCQKGFSNEISGLRNLITQVQTDVDWLKRFFWLVASSSIGALVVSLINLLVDKKN